MSAARPHTPVGELTVFCDGTSVGTLSRTEAKGIYFTYDDAWLARGFDLSPFVMTFGKEPQLARDPLFRGLHGPFADSLPDGWGLLLMDRFFDASHGVGTARTLSPLDRLAYMGDRAMGALEYRPATENEHPAGAVDLATLFRASVDIQEGATDEVLKSLRLAGGSPGGARPKAIVALSDDHSRAASAFAPLAPGFEHWIVKFHSIDEGREAGGVERAYAILAERSGIDMAPSALLDVGMEDGAIERFFATRRFDRDGERKRHMMTASALVHADFRAPSLDYSELLKLTQSLTKNALDVERMARLMIFNALAHNRDDHAKNFTFLHAGEKREEGAGAWMLAPAYDLTFSAGMGEHTTAYAGRGKATRAIIRSLCKAYRFLRADDYIDQTLEALATRDEIFASQGVPERSASALSRALTTVRDTFEASI